MADNAIIIKKKKVHGAHAHHGGSWKVAYADFVTAMMAFFMVLWIMGLSDETQTAISGYFNDPMGFMKNMPNTKNVINQKSVTWYKPRTSESPGKGTGKHSGISATEYDEADRVTKQLKQSVDSMPDLEKIAKQLEIMITDEGIRIELVEDAGSVFFESGKAVLKPEGLRILKNIAPIIGGTGRKIVIEGHTDAKPYAGATYTNWELSTDRAKATRLALSSFGLGPSRYAGIRGLADTQLKYPDRPMDVSNRRVSILLPWKKDVVQQKIQPFEVPKIGSKTQPADPEPKRARQLDDPH